MRRRKRSPFSPRQRDNAHSLIAHTAHELAMLQARYAKAKALSKWIAAEGYTATDVEEKFTDESWAICARGARVNEPGPQSRLLTVLMLRDMQSGNG